MDLDLSAYLLRKERKEEQVDEEDEVTSPGTQEYQHTLLKVISRSKGKSTQKGVLSFNVTTPSIGEGTCMNMRCISHNSLKSIYTPFIYDFTCWCHICSMEYIVSMLLQY